MVTATVRAASILIVAIVALGACTTAVQQTGSAEPQQTGSAEPQETGDGDTAAPSAAQEGGTLIIGRSSDSVTLDPQDSSEIQGASVTGLIFDTLVRFAPDSSEVEPWLATGWETSADGLTWHFHLREDAMFTDGNPVNADAVEFTFMRFLDPSHPNYQFGTWGLSKTLFALIAEVRAVGEFDVDFMLKQPFSPILASLVSPRAGIVSPAAISADPENAFQDPVGSGLFKLQEWRKDDIVTLIPNEDHWAGPPLLDQVIFRVIPDTSARLLALQNGDIHVMEGINPATVQALEDDPAVQLYESPGLLHAYLGMNHSHPPLDDVRVREAIFRAIDRDQIVETLFTDAASVATGIMSSNMPGADPTIEWPTFDPTAARQLLADAGYADGFTLELISPNSARSYLPDPPKTAQAIQAYLADIGITVEISLAEVSEVVERARAFDYGLLLLGLNPAVADPWTITFSQFDSRATAAGSGSTISNYAFYRNPAVDALNDEGVLLTDPAERAAVYEEMQQLIREDIVRVDLAEIDDQLAVRNEVRDFVYRSRNGYYSLENTWVSEE